MRRPRVLLADDHRLGREAFARRLEPDCEVVGVVADGRALLDNAPALRSDIVVLDVAMSLLDGLDAERQMPGVKLIFLTVKLRAGPVRREARHCGRFNGRTRIRPRLTGHLGRWPARTDPSP